MDDDSDLSLNMKEFKKGIHDYGLIMDDDVVSSLFQQLDKDHSGSLSFDEFLTALRVSDVSSFPFWDIFFQYYLCRIFLNTKYVQKNFHWKHVYTNTLHIEQVYSSFPYPFHLEFWKR